MMSDIPTEEVLMQQGRIYQVIGYMGGGGGGGGVSVKRGTDIVFMEETGGQKSSVSDGHVSDYIHMMIMDSLTLQ